VPKGTSSAQELQGFRKWRRIMKDCTHPKITYEEIFGTKTGTHTHPVTHPLWMIFTDGECLVCDKATEN
jgi:hypothetical protein